MVKKTLLVVALGWGLIASPARMQADATEPVTRVEEDWVLVLNEPDADVEAPQFHTVMSPTGSDEGVYAQVMWNYREQYDDYLPGGLQIQCWNGESKTKSRNVEYGQLSLVEETIKWSQSLEVNGSWLAFSIINGTSTTWGSFGKDLYLSTESGLSDLSQYSPEYSAKNSWFTFGANRVDSLVINEVRYYHDDELLFKDTADRVVYETPAE